MLIFLTEKSKVHNLHKILSVYFWVVNAYFSSIFFIFQKKEKRKGGIGYPSFFDLFVCLFGLINELILMVASHNEEISPQV